MPIIDGAKMACEPCIRGHRSTKCNHANERIMIPVRKPGRPLSVCPHPKSNSCSCSTVTAALPRTKKCGCRPKGTAHSSTKQQKVQLRRSGFSTPNSVARPPDAPATPMWLNTSDPSGRRYTIDAFPRSYPVQNSPAFSPKDPSYSYGYATPGPPKDTGFYQAAGNTGLGNYYSQGVEMAASLSQKSEFDELAFGIEPVGMAAAQFHHLEMMEVSSGSVIGVPQNMHAAAPMPTPDSAPRPLPPAADAGRSCCGNRPRMVTDASRHHTPTSSTNSLVSTGGVSLVSNSATSPSSSLGGSALFADFLPQQQTNGTQSWPCYPADLDTVTAPLQQSQQWPMRLTAGTQVPDMVTAMDLSVFSASIPMDAISGMQHESDTNGLAATADAQAMLCDCGDGCECVGCVIHPYNQATRDTVHAAWSSMMVPGANNGPGGPMGTVADTAAMTGAGSTGPVADGYQSVANGAEAARTPSDGSVASDEQTDLPRDDFLFVRYLLCQGESNTCPCGDDCQCVGCSVHNHQPD